MQKHHLSVEQRVILENLRAAIDAVIRLPANDVQAIEAHLTTGSFPHIRSGIDDVVLSCLKSIDDLDDGQHDGAVWDETCERLVYSP